MPYKDPEKARISNVERQARWRARNPDVKPTPEKKKEYNDRWFNKNPEVNRKRAIEQALIWRRKYPEVRTERERKRRARKLDALGWMPPFPEGILFGAQGGLCLYCKTNLEDSGWEMDHKIPHSRGGKHEYTNVCLCCKSCNQRKGSKTPQEFMK